MNHSRSRAFTCLLVLFASLVFSPLLRADNKVLGEVELVGASKVENTSGVWVDGQYGKADISISRRKSSCAQEKSNPSR